MQKAKGIVPTELHIDGDMSQLVKTEVTVITMILSITSIKTTSMVYSSTMAVLQRIISQRRIMPVDMREPPLDRTRLAFQCWF